MQTYSSVTLTHQISRDHPLRGYPSSITVATCCGYRSFPNSLKGQCLLAACFCHVSEQLMACGYFTQWASRQLLHSYPLTLLWANRGFAMADILPKLHKGTVTVPECFSVSSSCLDPCFLWAGGLSLLQLCKYHLAHSIAWWLFHLRFFKNMHLFGGRRGMNVCATACV